MGRHQRQQWWYPTHQIYTLQNHFHFIKTQNFEMFRASLVHPQGTLHQHSFGGCSVLLSYSPPHPPSSSSSSSSYSSSSLGSISIISTVSTSALGLMCDHKYSIQHRFSSPVPLMKTQRTLTEVVLKSFGYCFGLLFCKLLKCRPSTG
jgi:hypothetical protein